MLTVGFKMMESNSDVDGFIGLFLVIIPALSSHLYGIYLVCKDFEKQKVVKEEELELEFAEFKESIEYREFQKTKEYMDEKKYSDFLLYKKYNKAQ